MHITVVGAGLMGTQIGCDFALGGHRVTILTRDPERATGQVENALALAVRHGIATGDALERASALIATARGDADPECDLVVESLPEEFDLKAAALRRIARAAPDAVLATNTSSLSVSALGEAVGAPERVLGAHYWNPPLLMPLVEVTSGERTAPAAVERVIAALEPCGKQAIRVEKEAPGFIWNRLQLAVLRESVALAESGVATPDTIDAVMRLGLARRWRHTGPFETAALGGAETFIRAARNILPSLSSATDLDRLADLLPTDPDRLTATASRRDAALARELIDDDA